MPETTISPACRIVTPRLVVRCWSPVDAPILMEAIVASIEHLRPFMPWAREEPQPLDKKVELLRQFRGKFDLGQDFIYGILDCDERRVIGGTGLHPRLEAGALEIGYWVRAEEQGKGFISEAVSALVRVGFEIHQLRRLEIRNDPANTRSRAVAQRLGFTFEGTKRRCLGSPGQEWRDAQMWTLLREEYPASPAKDLPIEAFNVIGERLI